MARATKTSDPETRGASGTPSGTPAAAATSAEPTDSAVLEAQPVAASGSPTTTEAAGSDAASAGRPTALRYVAIGLLAAVALTAGAMARQRDRSAG